MQIDELKLQLLREQEARLHAEKQLIIAKNNISILQNSLTEKSILEDSLFKNIYHQYHHAIFILDKEKNKAITCNKKALQLFKIEDENELLAKFDFFLFTIDGKFDKKNILTEAYNAHIEFEVDYELQNNLAEKFVANIIFKPLSIQNSEYLLLQLHDVTLKNRFEKSLILNQKKYKDLINYSQALICTHDFNGTILLMNFAALDAIQLREKDAVGVNLKDIISKKYITQFDQYLKRISTNNSDSGILIINDGNGGKKYLMYQNYRVDSEYGQPYVVGFAQDISERILIEKKLKKAKALAEESVNARKIFLASMSHEMRTPLNGILGMAGLLNKTSLLPKQHNYLKIIQESANNLLLIINDILDFTNIESGKFRFEEKTFDIDDTLNSCVKSLSYKAEEKGLRVIAKFLKTDDAVVVGDQFRLNQILFNLINNAIKFTNSGIIEVFYSVIKIEEDIKTFQFNIVDQGIGIEIDKINKIFEGFTQADEEMTRRFGGLGLGLNICKNLVQLQGGNIFVEKTNNTGSHFIFNIPYKSGLVDNLVKKIPLNINSHFLGDLKILLVEDNEVNQLLVLTILEQWGLSVITAMNGREALYELREHEFDLILMDIHMPEMDGIEATGLIRKLNNQRKAATPIIAITADVQRGEEEKFFKAGMNDYLTKPFNETSLFEKIKSNINLTIQKSFDVTVSVPKTYEKIKLYDLAQIKAATHGNQQLEKKIITAFIDSTTKIIEEMEASLSNNNFENLKLLAHKLKTSIDSLSIECLKSEVRFIEKFAGNYPEHESIDQRFNYINTILNVVIEDLSIYLSNK